jgi:hypothetical protein
MARLSLFDPQAPFFSPRLARENNQFRNAMCKNAYTKALKNYSNDIPA